MPASVGCSSGGPWPRARHGHTQNELTAGSRSQHRAQPSISSTSCPRNRQAEARPAEYLRVVRAVGLGLEGLLKR